MWKRHHTVPDDEEIEINEANDTNFDDYIIEQTQWRIDNELSISSSIETKSSVIVGTIGGIFAIMPSVSIGFLLAFFSAHQLAVISFFVGAGLLSVSFAYSFAIIKPKVRLKLFNPLKANNEFSKYDIADAKYQIKCNLILDLEFIRKAGKNDLMDLKQSYWFFILGIAALAITYLQIF